MHNIFWAELCFSNLLFMDMHYAAPFPPPSPLPSKVALILSQMVRNVLKRS